MANDDRSAEDARSAGLCASCRSARKIVSAKGSVFWLCERATVEAAFSKYPRLPVLRCRGFEALEVKPPQLTNRGK
jgi:hypothetical protein